MKRVWAISDIHVDHRENRLWLERLCGEEHGDDILILAGDVASNRELVEWALERLAAAYSRVFFVPGNHDLWVIRDEPNDSLDQFNELMGVCSELGVLTQATRISAPEGGRAVFIVPLNAWYSEPAEGEDSLFVPKEGEDPSLSMWADRARIRWPDSLSSPAAYFLSLNQLHETVAEDTDVISFSHFLPRTELIFSSADERARFGEQGGDRAPLFNFSRVAGSMGIERQIRQLGSVVHVHGHQHRNRDREIEGVRYVSHCLGYPQERRSSGRSLLEIEPIEVFRLG